MAYKVLRYDHLITLRLDINANMNRLIFRVRIYSRDQLDILTSGYKIHKSPIMFMADNISDLNEIFSYSFHEIKDIERKISLYIHKPLEGSQLSYIVESI
jgi:hypothetical protein